jgi:hypothetical protein
MDPRNVVTYRRNSIQRLCVGGPVPKDAESVGREDKPLLDFSS